MNFVLNLHIIPQNLVCNLHIFPLIASLQKENAKTAIYQLFIAEKVNKAKKA